MRKMKFQRAKIPYFALSEICFEYYNHIQNNSIAKMIKSDNFLDENTLICDYLSNWETEIKKYISEHLKANENKNNKEYTISIFSSLSDICPIQFKIFLKIQIHYTYGLNDYDTIAMIYYQAINDVLYGKYILKDDQIVSLAANQLLVEFELNKDLALAALNNNLSNYIPYIHMYNYPTIYWSKNVYESYLNLHLNFKGKKNSKINYIDIVKKIGENLFDVHLFSVRVSKKYGHSGLNLPDELTLGLSSNLIYLYKNKVKYMYNK
jgi:hypothetical protein